MTNNAFFVITPELVGETLKEIGTDSAKAVAENPKELNAIFGVLKGIAEKNKVDVAVGLASLGGAGVAKSNASKSTKDFTAAMSFTVSVADVSWALSSVNKLTPGRAVVAIGAATIKKTAMTFGMVGDEQGRVRCYAALAETGASAGLLAAVAPTGIGAVIGLASLALSAIDSYNQCKDVL